MTIIEREQVAALSNCRFSPGSTAKAFVRKMSDQPPTVELSTKQTAFLNNLAHSYRGQIGRCMATACDKCKASLRLPKIEYEVDNRTNTKWGRIQRQTARPAFEVAIAVLEMAESSGAKYVHWFYRNPPEPDGASYRHVIAIHRCECTEVVLGMNVCRTCQLIAALTIDTDKRGPQVQYERAERALDRVSAMCVELQLKAKGMAA